MRAQLLLRSATPTGAGRGADLGIDPSKLQSDAGLIVDRLFEFQVAARLPGKLQSSNAPSQAGNGALWKARWANGPS